MNSRAPGKKPQWNGALCCIFSLSSTLLAQSSPTPDPLKNARALVASNKLAQANEMLSTLVASDPGNLPAWTQLGEVQLAQRLNDDAMSSFETVLESAPHSEQAQAGEVQAATRAAIEDRNGGNSGRALADLARARKYAPQSTELLIDFGIQADSMQIFKDAEQALQEALRLDAKNPRALYGLAHIELDEQQMDRAEEHLRAYLQLRPGDATAHYGLGHLLYMTSKYEDAKVELDRSIALQPHQTESYYELGQIALDSHLDADAKAEFIKVLQAAPTHAGALTGMGVLCFRTKDYAGAERYLKQAVASAPEYVPSHRYYAMTLARLGRDDQSREESTIAQELTERQEKLRHGYTLQPDR